MSLLVGLVIKAEVNIIIEVSLLAQNLIMFGNLEGVVGGRIHSIHIRIN